MYVIQVRSLKEPLRCLNGYDEVYGEAPALEWIVAQCEDLTYIKNLDHARDLVENWASSYKEDGQQVEVRVAKVNYTPID